MHLLFGGEVAVPLNRQPTQYQQAEYLASLLEELRHLAVAAEFRVLAYLIGMASEEARDMAGRGALRVTPG